MGDMVDLDKWAVKKEELLLNRLSKEYEELAYDIMERYAPQDFVRTLIEIIEECIDDPPSLMFLICIIEIIKLSGPEYYLDMVVSNDYEQKVIKPLTDFLTKSEV